MSISFKNVRHYILCYLGECYGRNAKNRVDKKDNRRTRHSTYDGFNKSLGIMQEYSNGILYSELKKFILQNSEMLKKFTTKNLYTLLASTYDESEKQIINEQIAERLEKEDFFCEDIDSEVFLHPIHTYDSYGKIDKDVRNKINIELEKQLKELGKEYEIIDKNIKN